MGLLSWIILLIVLAAIVIALAAWLYERATNEVSLVRTGAGGRKVVIDGGTLAIPFFHEITRVNMQTIRMDVSRSGESSLITKDRMRVDVGAEFYASVVPDEASISLAAQTLGRRVFHPEQLKGLVDGMMIDALRAVAAQMTMDELHEDRAGFVAAVRDALKDNLAGYGLQLDSVSLTDLDQTPFAALDENNAFNAVGMRKLAEVISKSKMDRAMIESDTDVAVRQSAMEASKRKLEIDLEERRAEIAHTQEVETLLAAQLADIAAKKADGERQAAQSRIRMEQDIQSADIARELAIREAEIAQATTLEIAEQDRQILVAAKSREESQAQAQADIARAEAVTAAEAVLTARQLAEAERQKSIGLLRASQEAEAAATRARITADSNQATAKNKAIAMREEADALKYVHLAEAEADRARIEARNARSDALAALELEQARLNAMPGIIAEMVKPAEKITGISINHISGKSGDATSPVNQTIESIMEMAVQMPVLNKIGAAIGVNVAEGLQEIIDPPKQQSIPPEK